jgi:putative FmdB family regulatory protein
MPTYEYECEGCHHTFEVAQRFSDPPPKACPRCRGRVRKVFYPVGVIFRGSGWHVTDYDKNGPKGSPSSGSSGNGSSKKDKVSSRDD